MNITKETKWPLSYCCHDNSYATGPVLIKTKIPKFHLTQGSSTPKNLIGRVKTMWEPCPFPGRPPVPLKKVANGDIWFYTERDWNQYGVISPPKFDFCFRCSVHILCLCSAIRHYSLAMWHRTCNIRVSQCDIEVWQYDVGFSCHIPITRF